MKDEKQTISRREFAQRAAMLSAATMVPAAVALPDDAVASEATQTPAELPKLSAQGSAEAEARYHLVLSRHGAQLSEEQKVSIRKMCYEAQPGLERVRAFAIGNGDVPALFLRPIVEREKNPAAKET